jgi:CubicO group peptidase (beta-lactamase class C family)
MITRLTSPAFSICAEVHVPAPLNVYRHRADLIQEFGRRNATFWVSWKVPARGERRLRTRIASRAGRLARTVLRPEAFEARPGFEQGPVDREVLTRQQGFGHNPLPGSIGTFYWTGAWGTTFWVDPAEKLIAIQMIQVPLSEGGAYRRVFRELTYAALTGTE